MDLPKTIHRRHSVHRVTRGWAESSGDGQLLVFPGEVTGEVQRVSLLSRGQREELRGGGSEGMGWGRHRSGGHAPRSYSRRDGGYGEADEQETGEFYGRCGRATQHCIRSKDSVLEGSEEDM